RMSTRSSSDGTSKKKRSLIRFVNSTGSVAREFVVIARQISALVSWSQVDRIASERDVVPASDRELECEPANDFSASSHQIMQLCVISPLAMKLWVSSPSQTRSYTTDSPIGSTSLSVTHRHSASSSS